MGQDKNIEIEKTLELSEYLEANSDRREKEVGDRVKIFDCSFSLTTEGKEFFPSSEGAQDTFIVIEKGSNFPTHERFWELKKKEDVFSPEVRELAIGEPNDLLITNGKVKLYIRSIQVQLPDFKKNETKDMVEAIKNFVSNL